MINGEPLDRSDDDAPPPNQTGKPRLSSVPKAGKKRGDEPDGGMEPQPS